VGKTFVTSLLGAGLSESVPTLALKPIETGVRSDDDGDAGVIARAAGHSPRLSEWRYADGVSPHLAARRAGVTIDCAAVAAWVRAREAEAPWGTVTLVETAGGALSPLAPGATNADLALLLEPAIWLVVAHDSLGVLHDVTALLRALPRPPDALVLCAARAADESSGTNARELAELRICAPLPCIERWATSAPALVQWLLDLRSSFRSGH
jgi:dethiobiotin synthetase